MGNDYHLVLENPNHKWRFLAGNIIYFYGPLSMAMLNNQRLIAWWYTEITEIPSFDYKIE